MLYDNIKSVREKLLDEESIKIYDARLQYVFDRDWNLLLQNLINCGMREFECNDFKKFIHDKKDKKIVVYGLGMMGKYAGTLLEHSGFNVYAYGDSKQQLYGKKWNGIKILSDEEILKEKEELVLVIGSSRFATEIYYKLLGLGINRNQIYFPCHGFMSGTYGIQYFDFFKPQKGEIFIDAGVYDGATSIAFANWCTDYEKIYLFEANIKDKQQIINKMEQNGIKKYDLIMKGVSDQCKTARMYDWMYSSQVNDEGSLDIELTSIDEELKGNKATFIKMDVEGEEYKALLGAKNTIKQYKPRMAISLYHKMDDIVTIPLLISELNSEYQFAMRHYTSTPHETVLYAW